MKLLLSLVFCLVLFGGCSSSTGPGDNANGDEPLPVGLELAVEVVASGFSSPLYLTAPPSDARLFVVEQSGRIHIIENGSRLATPFLDITDRVLSGGERGLLSVAFHPQYATNGFFYVSYNDHNGDTRIERYTVTADVTLADQGSAKLILSVEQPFSNHNGGLIVFGPDGMLYVGLGDGGSGGDPLGHGQNRNSLLGALLRIDVDGGDPFAVPPDNPFVGDAGARAEIWAYGLRNPWRFAFDRQEGNLYIADVGQNLWEEVSVVTSTTGGLNFGWNTMEGAHCFPSGTCSTDGLVIPTLEYGQSNGACSITGGYVYRGDAIPAIRGHYFYSDYCAGFLRSFRFSDGGASLENESITTSPVTHACRLLRRSTMVSLNSLSRALVTHIMSTRVLGCALLSGFVAIAGHGPAPLAAQATDQAAASAESPNYRLAGRFAPYKIQELIHSTSVEPNWIENSERFWYSWETGDGKSYYLVDPEAGTKNDIFDSDRIAAELTRITLDPWDGKHLPIRNIRFLDGNTLQFDTSEEEEEDEERDERRQDDEEEEEEEEENENEEDEAKVFHFEYDVTTRTLRELADWEGPDNHPDWASVSPDGQTVIFARNHNIHMMSGADYAQILDARRGESGDDADEAEEDVDVEDTQLTTDGEEHYSYASFQRGPTDVERGEDKDKRKSANISWTKDSRRFAMIRNDRRTSQDLWVIHSTGNKRPELETYKYDLPGDTTVSQPEMLIYDLPARKLVKVRTDGWKDQRLFMVNDRQFVYPDSEEPRRSLWLSETSDELHFLRRSRDQHRIDVMVADASTGEVRVLIEERLNTYVENQPIELLASGDMIWWSERDGWAHLYLFEADGTLRHRLTEGAFSVRRVVGVDEERGIVYFMANAREAGEDPYYQHLYRVSLEGTDLQLVAPGDFDHRSVMGESNRFLVDNYARVNSVPASALHDVAGRKIMDLEVADFSALTEAGYQFPEPYTVKADDGITDLYGNIYRPFDFDPDKSYPIIAYVYPGPQTEAVSKFFSTNATETALAQFGFIVVTIGNRGGHPARSKWYHNYGYGNLRDYGLSDKKAAIEQLADRYDYIDIDRVGIYGHSGGGFMSTAAMLVYPDFFKVAVSSSGNHDNDVYNANWSEKHDGIEEVVDDEGEVTFEYDIDRNSDLAANLKGHLLLTTSDEDNNVHPAGTLRMADALIRANKRFDFFVFSGQRHGYGNMSDYWFWLRAEYFVDHLLGNGRWSADISELQVESPKTGSRRTGRR